MVTRILQIVGFTFSSDERVTAIKNCFPSLPYLSTKEHLNCSAGPAPWKTCFFEFYFNLSLVLLDFQSDKLILNLLEKKVMESSLAELITSHLLDCASKYFLK